MATAMAETDVTIEEFIEKYLIKHIEAIKKEYPYEAFLLISCGIEFLGKYIDLLSKNEQDASNFDWHEPYRSKKNFTQVFSRPGLSKYDSIKDDLYDCLRCGLCHAYQVKPGIRISDDTEEKLSGNDKIVNINNYYNAFKTACEDILKNEKTYLRKFLFQVKETNNGAISGSTATII